jgi:hypothetical protein
MYLEELHFLVSVPTEKIKNKTQNKTLFHGFNP